MTLQVPLLVPLLLALFQTCLDFFGANGISRNNFIGRGSKNIVANRHRLRDDGTVHPTMDDLHRRPQFGLHVVELGDALIDYVLHEHIERFKAILLFDDCVCV